MAQTSTNDPLTAPTGFAAKHALKVADNSEELTVEKVFLEVFSPERNANFTRFQTILMLPHIFSQMCLPVAPALTRLWLYGELPKVASKPGVNFELIRPNPGGGGNNKLYLETQLELFDSPLFKGTVERAERASQEALNQYFANSAVLREFLLPGLRRQRSWPSEREWAAAKPDDQFPIGDFNHIEFPQIRVHAESEGGLLEQISAFMGLSPELDLMASLGRFNVLVYFDGVVVKKNATKGTVIIKRRGVRLYDSFNFEDADSRFSQILGVWEVLTGGCGQLSRFINQTLLALREINNEEEPLAGLLTNASFRSFRKEVMNIVNSRLEEHARGGRRVTAQRLKCKDFDIFTRMKITPVDPQQEFEVEF